MNWQPLTSQTDLDELQSRLGWSDDARLEESYLWSGHSVSPDVSGRVPFDLDIRVRVRLLFQRPSAGPSAIELLFGQVTTFHLQTHLPYFDDYVSFATLLHRDGLFYWANEYRWSPEKADRDKDTWIAGKALSWRDASDWMASDLRLGPGMETPVH